MLMTHQSGANAGSSHSLDSSLPKSKQNYKPVKILIIDDEAAIREVLSASLRDEGHTVLTAHDADSGLKILREFQPEIVFLDIWMPGSRDGVEVLTEARKLYPHVEFVMISGHGTIETAVKSTKLGAWDFIEKPLSMDKILIVISNIVQYQQEREEKETLLNKLRKNIALIGEAQKMMNLKQMIARCAPTHSWVLLQGENGSGKHLVAQNIHYMSSRAGRPFVEVNCSNLAEDLIDAELFGFDKGGIIGVEHSQKGKIELAQGGTLFLDEISLLSSVAQEKLLQLLQDRKFKRLGATEWREIDVRVVASTQADLAKMVEAGTFREDLYHRLNVVFCQVPALREHAEDIPSLVQHFSDQAARESGVARKLFSEKALKVMAQYTWPGNIRELRNFVERIYILTPSEFVDVHDLRFAGLVVDLKGSAHDDLPSFREARARFEKDYLLKKINENNGNISRTAEAIGLERSYLHRKIKTFGIEIQKGNDDSL